MPAKPLEHYGFNPLSRLIFLQLRDDWVDDMLELRFQSPLEADGFATMNIPIGEMLKKYAFQSPLEADGFATSSSLRLSRLGWLGFNPLSRLMVLQHKKAQLHIHHTERFQSPLEADLFATNIFH